MTFPAATGTVGLPPGQTKSIDCQISMADTNSQGSFSLSADRATLTEADVSEVVHEHYSSQARADVHNTDVSQGPTISPHRQNMTKETHITVHPRQ